MRGGTEAGKEGGAERAGGAAGGARDSARAGGAGIEGWFCQFSAKMSLALPPPLLVLFLSPEALSGRSYPPEDRG